MKILLTTNGYLPQVNGVVTSILCLKAGLESRGHEVRILAVSPTARSFREGDVYYIGSTNAGKVYPGIRVKTAMSGRFVRDILQWGPDIVHSQCEFSTFRAARKIADETGAPLIHTYHTVYEDYTHYFSPSKRVGRKAVAAFTRGIAERVDCMVAPTHKIELLLRRYHIASPIRVVPTGIGLTSFCRECDESAGKALRCLLGIPTDHLVILTVGRLAAEKNTAELIRLFAQSALDKVTFVIVGDGPCKKKLEQQAEELEISDRVRFTGMIPREKIAPYYQIGDLFVSASTSETQGLTYVEALAAGKPLLCRRDVCLEGMIEQGVNGWQYDTPQDFQDGLAWFAAHPQEHEKMAARSRELARAFSVDSFARSVEKIYIEFLAKKALGDSRRRRRVSARLKGFWTTQMGW